MPEKQTIVTIDGPAGVGKSTVSKRVAAASGFTYLDTGAMYRAVGLFLQQEGVEPEDTERVIMALDRLQLQIVPAPDENTDVGVVLGGEDVTAAIRTPEMAMVASKVSAVPAVRRILTQMQQTIGAQGKVVAEGRDTGTVVFPHAAFKFFLDAHPEVRAKRRVDQLHQKGAQDVNYDDILAMTIKRDRNDSERDIAPLKASSDAVIIDTTKMTLTEVVEAILNKMKEGAQGKATSP